MLLYRFYFAAMPIYPGPDFRPTYTGFTAADLVKRDWQHCPEAMEGWGRVYEEDDARYNHKFQKLGAGKLLKRGMGKKLVLF